MYTRSAIYYDTIYRDLKNYREEAAKINHLLQQLTPKPEKLLDVGCGTGEHAKQLSQSHGYQVDGVDIQPEFIEIAQKKLPDSRFTVGDMRSFELEEKYDVLLCLFSSIGYSETLQGLENTLQTFAKHLAPNGWLVCEPWITPDIWHPGQVDSISATDPQNGDLIVRTRTGESDGDISVLKIDYEIRGKESINQFSETHRLGLFTRDQMNRVLAKAGFQARWLEVGLQSQSLIVAQLQERR